jgi:release factor glutamine methyltransferase
MLSTKHLIIPIDQCSCTCFAVSLPGMTIHQATEQLTFQLYRLYSNREACLIADWVMEHITAWKRIDRILRKNVPLLPHQERLLANYTAQLLTHKPVQYVLNEAWFYGMKLWVDDRVLIPRPETEELVAWVLESTKQQTTGRIIDIGTGSGCIALALKKNLPNWQVHACDISEAALAVAKTNASAQQLSIHWHQINILNTSSLATLPAFDCIISNPPYVTEEEKANMTNQVLAYEPHLALFVADSEPLIFYEAIAAAAANHLLPGGNIYVEINEGLATVSQQCFAAQGFENIAIKKDNQGKDRMMKISVSLDKSDAGKLNIETL